MSLELPHCPPLAELDRALANSIIRQIRPAAPVATGAAAGNDCEESNAMAILGGGHEEASLNGTGISHIRLIGKPEFGGIEPGATPGEAPSVLVRDGAFELVLDDLDLVLAWRDAFQHAASALIIHRESQAARS